MRYSYSIVQKRANGICGLSDYSSAGDWRLPTLHELVSLLDYRYHEGASPVLSNAAGTGRWEGELFNNIQMSYWSSKTEVQHEPHK